MKTTKKSRYEFNSAAKLYRDNSHPRVLLGPDDLVLLKRQVKVGDGKKIMAALRRKVHRIVGFIEESDDLARTLKGDGSHNSKGSQIGRCLTDMAFVAALDEDSRTMAAIRRLFSMLTQHKGKARPRRAGSMHSTSLAQAFDLLYHQLTPAERRAYVATARSDVSNLIERTKGAYFKCAGGNITLGTTLSAIPVLLAIMGEPGAGDSSKQMAYLVKCTEATLNVTTNPNGYPEEDTGYGTGVAAWLAYIVEMLRRAGMYNAYKECPRFKNFGRAVLHFVEPWGVDLANTGDHGDDFGSREFVLARLASETNDPSLLWLLGTLHYHHGKVHPENKLPELYIEVPLRKGFRTPASYGSLLVLEELKGEKRPTEKTVPTAFMDPGRGIVSFRSGWGDDDAFVVFDGSHRSPAAQGHAHASCGDFTISAVGEYFAIGTGRYQNEQDQHSVVLVDGKSGRSNEGQWTAVQHAGLLTGYEPGEFVDFAAADSSHQHNCYWARRYLGLVKGDGAHPYVWTVEDINKNNDRAQYWWQLQTSPENTIEIRKTSATIKGWRHGNLMDVHFALPAREEYPNAHTLKLTQDVGSSCSYKYLVSDPSNVSSKAFRKISDHVKRYERPSDTVHGPVYMRPRLLAKVAGWNGRFMSIMLPRKKNEKAAKVTRLKSLPASLAVRVTFAKVEDVVIFAYEHNLLEAGGITGRGRWCVVRRDRKTGKVVDYTIGDGTSLRVDGRKLRI